MFQPMFWDQANVLLHHLTHLGPVPKLGFQLEYRLHELRMAPFLDAVNHLSIICLYIRYS